MSTLPPARLTSDYPIQPVPFTAVRLTGGIWRRRQEVNRTVTIPYAIDQCAGRMRNFDLAAETMARRAAGDGSFQHTPVGEFPFDDSDPYKVIEAAAFTLAQGPDPDLDARLDGMIARIAAAQEPDGYLYTWRTMHPDSPAHPWIGARRWELDPELSHELYNLGHLFEAGVAHAQATGKRTLLDPCLKAAELVHRDFLVGGLRLAPGHQVIEIGLAKLHRLTGDRRWLDLATYFLDIRGPGGNPYHQAHARVADQGAAVGHAVRAGYLYAGMADVAALGGDPAYARAAIRIWRDVVGGKLHLTGGIGARYEGEAFGEAYELPHRAYNETCAAIANLMWNHRLFLLTGEADYLDVYERTLNNAFPSGVSLSGDRFFYPNVLINRGRGDGVRSPWFGCACCPPNVARTLASLAGACYAVRGDELFVAQYAASVASIAVAGVAILVEQATGYPDDGRIRLTLAPASPCAFALRLRLPGWVQGRPVPSDLYAYADATPAPWTLHLNGVPVALAPDGGWLVMRRTWQAGDVVELDLGMPVRRVVGHPALAATRDQVAFERGPLVFAAEGVDQADPRVLAAWVPDGAVAEAGRRADLLVGLPVVRLAGAQRVEQDTAGRVSSAPAPLTLIPYHAWANRGSSPMRVWFPRQEDPRWAARPPTLASTAVASFSVPDRALGCLNDPDGLVGETQPAHADWWPHQGTSEWAQYDFPAPVTLRRSSIRWWDDTGHGGSRVPAAWRLLHRVADGSWQPIAGTDRPGGPRDADDRVDFPPVTTTGLRLEVQLQPGWSGGLVSWLVE